jgi:hypothetical protein
MCCNLRSDDYQEQQHRKNTHCHAVIENITVETHPYYVLTHRQLLQNHP